MPGPVSLKVLVAEVASGGKIICALLGCFGEDRVLFEGRDVICGLILVGKLNKLCRGNSGLRAEG